MRCRRSETFTEKIFGVLIGMALAGGFPILDRGIEQEEWKMKEFSGEILSRMKTGDHGIMSFEIRTDNGDIEVLDRFWKIYRYKNGDFVEKHQGEMGVLLLVPPASPSSAPGTKPSSTPSKHAQGNCDRPN